MRLSELNPRWSQCYRSFTPQTGGVDPLPQVQLSFTCPKCGNPYAICIYVGTEPADETKARWHSDTLPESPAWPDTLTITPSISCRAMQHGKRGPICGAHFSITNGEITP